MAEQFDKITEPQEWVDGLVEKYSPNAHDIDCALQNMGLKIIELEKRNNDLIDEAIKRVQVIPYNVYGSENHTRVTNALIEKLEELRDFRI